ncbi:MAG: hypothetical protein ACNS62_18415 [Candidatus Cyclobacteriaceae bacterium M3_2C_046]
MKNEQDYLRDLTEIRSMMERSSKFLSLSGWAGIMAGIYALAGAYIAYTILSFDPDRPNFQYFENSGQSGNLWIIILLGLIILVLALITAVYFSYKSAHKRGEKVWNATSRRLLFNMAVPLVSGGLLILILLTHGLTSLIASLTLIFYGLALYNASKFTYEEVKYLGLVQIGLGLISAYFVGYGLLLWAIGFGLVHIIYGIYMHLRYER